MTVARGNTVNVDWTLNESASTASLTCTLPSAMAAGKLLTAHVVASTSSPGLPATGSWQWAAGSPLGTNNEVLTGLAYTTDPAAGLAFTQATAGRMMVILTVYGGEDPLTVVDVTPTTNNVITQSMTLTGLTTVTDGDMLVSGCGINASTITTITQPSGFALIARNTSGTGKGGAYADLGQAVQGATGNEIWTNDAVAGTRQCGYLAAIRSASVATSPDTQISIPRLSNLRLLAPTPMLLAGNVAHEFGVAAGGDATATSATVAATAAIATPTVQAGSTIAATTVAATATVPTPTVQAGAAPAPATVAAVAAVGAASVLTGSTVSAATVAAVAAISAPTVKTGAAPGPATVAATAAVGAVTVKAGAVVTPATVAAVAAVATPSLGGSAFITPATVAATAAVPAVTIRAGSAPTPATVAATATVGGQTVKAGVTIAAATVTATAAIGAPTVSVVRAVTYRPFSGVTNRPGSGTTVRPSSGATARPSSGITVRPFTTVTPRP